MGETQQERRQGVPQHGGVEAERQGGGVDVLPFQVRQGGAQAGESGLVGAEQRGQVVAVEAGGLDRFPGQEARLHGEDGPAVPGGA
jgi:hypothetical protein